MKRWEVAAKGEAAEEEPETMAQEPETMAQEPEAIVPEDDALHGARVQHIPSALMRCRGGRWRDAVVAEHGVHAPLQQHGRPHHISSHAAVREGRVLSSELERKETAESQAAMLRAQKEWKKGTKKFTDQKKQQGSNFQLRPDQWEEIRKIFTQCWPFPSDATTNKTLLLMSWWFRTASRPGRWWPRCGAILE
ncbi:unnamed protein product [Cladocopium goreaui]|uniref:Uncharacterized protein n=1 Tax=Cladocopium goreaui TaxID=2562237 RepID=A0A9P1M3F2_9DINO|nr:unnamed protein product [Cladocopium goreaui]